MPAWENGFLWKPEWEYQPCTNQAYDYLGRGKNKSFRREGSMVCSINNKGQCEEGKASEVNKGQTSRLDREMRFSVYWGALLCKTDRIRAAFERDTLKANNYQQYTRHYTRHCEGHPEIPQKSVCKMWPRFPRLPPHPSTEALRSKLCHNNN